MCWHLTHISEGGWGVLPVQVVYVFMGSISGYVAARLYKSEYVTWQTLGVLMSCVLCSDGRSEVEVKCPHDSFLCARVSTEVPCVCVCVVVIVCHLTPLRACFAVFFILNLFLWGAGSSAAIPFTTLLALLSLWLGISLPLTFFGAFLGFRKAVSMSTFCDGGHYIECIIPPPAHRATCPHQSDSS